MDIKINVNYKDVFYMSDNLYYDSENISLDELQIPQQPHNVQFARLNPSNSNQLLYSLKCAAHYSVGGGHVTERKNRPDYQLILTMDGRAHASYDGNEYVLTAGSSLLVDCRKPHRYFVNEGDVWEQKHLHFTTTHPEVLLSAVPTYLPDFGQAAWFFDQMQSYSLSPKSVSQVAPFMYSNFIYNILTDLVKMKFAFETDENQKQFLEVIQYIHKHFNEPLSLKTLAQKFHYSESYFIRLFKKYYNETPYQYLIRYRLTKAKEMIWSGETVHRAALACGFNSTSAFYHAMKMNQ